MSYKFSFLPTLPNKKTFYPVIPLSGDPCFPGFYRGGERGIEGQGDDKKFCPKVDKDVLLEHREFLKMHFLIINAVPIMDIYKIQKHQELTNIQ